MANLLQGVSSKHGEILTFTLSQLDVLWFSLFLFSYPIHFPNLWCVF
jgi:hypothetical protein